MSGFKKAERKAARLKLAITGPSGSGKTYSALLIAAGLGGKVAVLDTENDSASLYAGMAGMPEFDTMGIAAPFLSEKYIRAVKEAVAAGYNVLVIDSTSHQWSGEGGILDRKDKEQMARPGTNGYTLWAKYTPEHEAFKAAINESDIHIIATIRSKQDYILEDNGKGKQAPKKVGMAPIQREGAEYEYTVVFDMSMENYAQVSKDRTGLFAGKFFKPTIATGAELLTWLNSGKAVEKPAPAAPALSPGDKARGMALKTVWNQVTWPEGSISDYCGKAYSEENPLKLNEQDFEKLLYLVKHQTASQARANLYAGDSSVQPPLGSAITPEDAAWEPPAELAEPGATG